MAKATAASITYRTGYVWNFCSSCRSRIPSNSLASRSRIFLEKNAGSPSRLTSNGCWDRRARDRLPFIITERDPSTGALFARNPWNTEFAERVAFADLSGLQTSWTTDRTEFIGRNGTLDHPIAMEGTTPLSGRVGAGLDPCAALRAPVDAYRLEKR